MDWKYKNKPESILSERKREREREIEMREKKILQDKYLIFNDLTLNMEFISQERQNIWYLFKRIFLKRSHECYKIHIQRQKYCIFCLLYIFRNSNVFNIACNTGCGVTIAYQSVQSVKITSREVCKMDTIRYFTTENVINLCCNLFKYFIFMAGFYFVLPYMSFIIKLLSRFILQILSIVSG